MNKKIDKIFSDINISKSIGIFRHENPDLDAFGSQIALYLFIKDNLNKEALLFGKEPNNSNLLFMPHKSKFLDYNIYKENLDYNIILDTANYERIDTNSQHKLKKINLKIDHHVSIDDYADINIILENKTSTSFILLEIFLYLVNKYNFYISNKVLELLYSGIIGDTGMFSHGNLDKDFFEKISYIHENIDAFKVHYLCFSKSINEKMIESKLINKIKIIGKFSYIHVDSLFLNKNEFNDIVNIMNYIKNINIWASFYYDNENKFTKCSIRSRNINLIPAVEEFGGGGHKFAVGAKIWSKSDLEKLKKKLIILSEKGCD